jgi:hypothetical protein
VNAVAAGAPVESWIAFSNPERRLSQKQIL